MDCSISVLAGRVGALANSLTLHNFGSVPPSYRTSGPGFADSVFCKETGTIGSRERYPWPCPWPVPAIPGLEEILSLQARCKSSFFFIA